MDEREWLTCDDPDRMLKFLGKKYSPRKLRLFAVACCRIIWDRLGEKSRRSVEVAERFVDGRATERALDEAGDAAFSEAPYRVDLEGEYNPAAWIALRNAYKAALDVSVYAAGWAVGNGVRPEAWADGFAVARAGHCPLLREIAGNPFRPAKTFPGVLAWQDSTVVRMAQALYEERHFNDMPVLADALEDAGCDNADILNHCRGGGEHVRGCWVIDLLTGRT
jgi:hypothetical protein